MNAILVGITRCNSDMQSIRECDVSVDQALGSDEVDAQTSFDGSFQEDLFGNQYIQKALESRDVMDQQGDAQSDQIAEDSNHELEPYSEDSALDKDGDEYAEAKTDDGIVDETVSPSPKKIRTRSKTQKVNLPDPIICSDPEDEEPRPR